jgi:hypothetical protein
MAKINDNGNEKNKKAFKIKSSYLDVEIEIDFCH